MWIIIKYVKMFVKISRIYLEISIWLVSRMKIHTVSGFFNEIISFHCFQGKTLSLAIIGCPCAHKLLNGITSSRNEFDCYFVVVGGGTLKWLIICGVITIYCTWACHLGNDSLGYISRRGTRVSPCHPLPGQLCLENRFVILYAGGFV